MGGEGSGGEGRNAGCEDVGMYQGRVCFAGEGGGCGVGYGWLW